MKKLIRIVLFIIVLFGLLWNMANLAVNLPTMPAMDAVNEGILVLLFLTCIISDLCAAHLAYRRHRGLVYVSSENDTTHLFRFGTDEIRVIGYSRDIAAQLARRTLMRNLDITGKNNSTITLTGRIAQ